MDTGEADKFGYSLGCIGTCRTAVALSRLNQTPRTAQSDAELTLSVLSTGDRGGDGATDQMPPGLDVSYDNEIGQSGSLTVDASDGNGGAAGIAITVNLTDRDESTPVTA